MKDVFTIRMLEEFDNKGNQVQERYNGSGATVYGANIEGKALFSQSLMLQGGLTWQKSRYKEPEQWSENPEVAPEKKMFRTPDIYGYFTMQYTFFDMNLKLAKDFSLFQGVTLQANCGIMNIFNSFQDDFDKGVDRDSGYMYGPMMPRSMYAGIKLSW